MALSSSSKHAITLVSRLPVYDFLAPTLCRRLPIQRAFYQSRSLSNTQRCLQATSTEFTKASAPDLSSQPPKSTLEAADSSKPPPKPLTQAQRDFLASALRVNQAGELAAVLIYAAQNPIILRSHPHLKDLMKHMYDQEVGHFTTFNRLIAKHRVRPSVMYPLWTIAASALGWGTAIMGREAAMACTEAVETEIGGHYNEQVRELLQMKEELEKDGQDIGPDLNDLIENIRRIRNEELEHLDIALDNDAAQAKPHQPLVDFIRLGCRSAIWVSQKI